MAVPTSSGGRSFSGSVFLDELAYCSKQKDLYDAAVGSTMLGGRIAIGSTPNGVGDLFHKICTSAENWSRHFVPIERAIHDGYPVDVQKCWDDALHDQRVFGQIYQGEFLDNDLQYIPSALIDSCMVDEAYATTGDCYAGIDVGRTHDRTVLYIVRKDPLGIRWCIYHDSVKRTEPEDLRRLVSLAINDFGCKRLVIDATGMGEFPTAEFQSVYGKHKVEAYKFSGPSKEHLATLLYSAFVDKTVRIGREDQQLKQDLLGIRRIITSAGNVTYDCPRTDEGHSDSAWALALALHASSGFTNRRVEVER